MSKILILGFGNADRQDDGVAWYILVGIAKKLGLKPPQEPGEPFETYQDDLDIQFMLQLYPEMAENLDKYDRVYFIDAHTGEIEQEISFQEVKPQYQQSPFTHHFTPQSLLSIAKTIFDRSPQSFLLSVRGYYFGFDRNLSSRTAQLCEEAISLLWQSLFHPRTPEAH